MSFGLWVLRWAEAAQNQPGQPHWAVPSISNQEQWLNWERTLTALFSSRFPFYYELKIAFVAWLLSPYTKGSSLLYRKFVHPTLSSKEKVITGAQVLLEWKQSAVFAPSSYHSFALKDWELLILFFCHLIISFWSVFLSFAVFFNKYWHLFSSLTCISSSSGTWEAGREGNENASWAALHVLAEYS